jgi:hypothetical protein
VQPAVPFRLHNFFFFPVATTTLIHFTPFLIAFSFSHCYASEVWALSYGLFCMNLQFLHVCYRVSNIRYAIGYVPIQPPYVFSIWTRRAMYVELTWRGVRINFVRVEKAKSVEYSVFVCVCVCVCVSVFVF